MSYSTKSESLIDVFKRIRNNRLVLPHFQREFLWSKKQQKGLLASFFIKLPIGSFLFLTGDKKEYPSKYIGRNEGVIEYDEIPDENVDFLLDGQQRITTLKSIFTNLFEFTEKEEEFKEMHKKTYNKICRKWFLKIDSEVGKDFLGFQQFDFRENKYKSFEPKEVEELFEYEKLNRSKGSNAHKDWFNPMYKFENNMTEDEYRKKVIENSAKEGRLPLTYLIDMFSTKIYNKDKDKKDTVVFKILEKIAQLKSDSNNNTKISGWVRDVYDYLESCLEQQLHIIKVPPEEKGRAIPIFEKINTGGTQLDTFDLIVAKAADKTENYPIYHDKKESLRNAIRRELKEKEELTSKNLKTDDMKSLPEEWTPESMFFKRRNKLFKEFKTRYLSLLTLTNNIYDANEKIQDEFIKKRTSLELTSHQINSKTLEVIKSLIETAKFLQFRCGLEKINNLSYGLMCVPISYVFLKEPIYKYKNKLNIIETWYWVSLLSGTYRDNKYKRCIKDIKLLNDVLLNEKNDRFEEFLNSYRDRFFSFEDYSDKKTLRNNDDVPRAVERTIKQYLLSICPNDLINTNVRMSSWEKAKGEMEIEMHHIIPLSSDKNSNYKKSTKNLRNNKEHILNSPLNYTPILKRSHDKIKGKDINNYLSKISRYPKEKHCFPTEFFGKNSYESTEEFYKKFLSARFETLKSNVINEIENLLSVTEINNMLN